MSYEPSPGRLEAFSDGVIAVIITIMVLEFKVPHDDGWSGFLTIVPTLLVYLISFAFTGVYWVNHHHLIDRLKRVDALVMYSNLLFLFCLSLLPFFTAYLVQKNLSTFSMQIYAGSLFVSGLAFNLLTFAIGRNVKHAKENDLPRHLQASLQHTAMVKGRISMGLYLSAIPLAQWKPAASLTAIALVMVLWIVPTFGLKPVSEMSADE